jgi:voltage-gated potassium channel
MELTITFVKLFFLGAYLLMPFLLFLCFFIVVLGQIVGRIQGWKRFDSFYWSFITALTVGYGDIKPLKRNSKTLSILIALLGIMFNGVVVALTVAVGAKAFERHIM